MKITMGRYTERKKNLMKSWMKFTFSHNWLMREALKRERCKQFAVEGVRCNTSEAERDWVWQHNFRDSLPHHDVPQLPLSLEIRPWSSNATISSLSSSLFSLSQISANRSKFAQIVKVYSTHKRSSLQTWRCRTVEDFDRIASPDTMRKICKIFLFSLQIFSSSSWCTCTRDQMTLSLWMKKKAKIFSQKKKSILRSSSLAHSENCRWYL